MISAAGFGGLNRKQIDGDVNVTVRARGTFSAASEQPQLANVVVVRGPLLQAKIHSSRISMTAECSTMHKGHGRLKAAARGLSDGRRLYDKPSVVSASMSSVSQRNPPRARSTERLASALDAEIIGSGTCLTRIHGYRIRSSSSGRGARRGTSLTTCPSQGVQSNRESNLEAD
jgi:hypothetical protein